MCVYILDIILKYALYALAGYGLGSLYGDIRDYRSRVNKHKEIIRDDYGRSGVLPLKGTRKIPPNDSYPPFPPSKKI